MIRTSSSYPTCAVPVPSDAASVANQQTNQVGVPKLMHNILPPPQAPIGPPPIANNAIKECGIISVNSVNSDNSVNNSVNCGNLHQKPNLAPGWRRCSYDNEIIYISPSGDVLKNLTEIKNYLLRSGTCKCGLPCPFRPEVFFEFDPQVPSASLPINLETDLSRRFCLHQRRHHLDKQELIRRGDIKNRKPSIGAEPTNLPAPNQNNPSQERIVIQNQNQNIRYNQNYSRPSPQHQLSQQHQPPTVQQPTVPVGTPIYQNNNTNEITPPTARSRTPPWRKNQNKIQQNQNEQPQIVQQQNFPNERVPPLPQPPQNQHWPIEELPQKPINKPRNNVKKRPTFKEDPTGYLNQQTAILHSSISTLHSPVGSSPSPTSSSQEKEPLENSENEEIYSNGYETNDQVTNLPNSTTIGGQTVTHMPNGMVQVHQNCDISQLKPQQQIQFQQQLQQHNQLIRQSHEMQLVDQEPKPVPRFVPPAQESPITSSRTPDVTSSCSTPDLKGPVQAGAISTSNRSPSLASSHPSPSESPESFVSRSSSSSFCPPKLQTGAYASGQTTLKNTVTSVIAGKSMTSTTTAIRQPVEQPKPVVQQPQQQHQQQQQQQQQQQHQQQQQQQQHQVNFSNQQQILMTSTGQIIVMPSQQNKIPIMTQNNGLMNQNFIMNGQNVILNNQPKQINFQQNPIMQGHHQQTVVLNTLPNGIMIQQQPHGNFSSVEGHHQVVNQIVNADGSTSYIQQTQQQRQIVISPDSKRKAKKRKSSSNGSITPGSLSPASSIQMSPTPMQQSQPQQQGTMLQITPHQYQQTQGIQLSPGISGLTLIPNKTNAIGQQQQIILQNGQTLISQPLNVIGQHMLLPAGLVMANDATLVQIQNMGSCGSIITPQGMVIRAQSPHQQKSFLSPNTGQQFIVNNNGQVSPMGHIYGTQLLAPSGQGPQFVQHQQNTTIIQQQPTHIINHANLNITGPDDLNSLNGHTIGTQTSKSQNMGHSGSASPPDTTTHSPNSPDRPPSEKSGGSSDSMNMAMVQCVSSSNERDHGVSPGIDSTQSPSNSIEYYERGPITAYHHNHNHQNMYKHSDAKIRRIQMHGPHTIISPDSHESPQTTTNIHKQQILPGNLAIGELVWGAVRGHPSWPGKVVPAPEGVTGGPIDCVWVRWFGGRPNAEMVSVHGLKSLSEGLEAHHKAQKDVRKSRKLNTQLERAIQEAMAELDRISAVDTKTKIIVNNNTSIINNNKPIITNINTSVAANNNNMTTVKIRPPNARSSKLVKIAPAPINLPTTTTVVVTGGNNNKMSPNNNNNNNPK